MPVPTWARNIYFGLIHNIPVELEQNVYDREWDVLILLDACRVDSLRAVASEFAWLPESIPSIWSVASQSAEWMKATFSAEHADDMAGTGYVTANPFSHQHINANDFAFVDEVWRDEWDHEHGTVPADLVTNRAIRAGRVREFDRIIIHYMQPHFPSAPDPVGDSIPLDEFGDRGLDVWNQLRDGELSPERAKESYVENLRYVLDSVGQLRDNLEAESAIITADHGECFGEWGLYGHPRNKPAPTLRQVPWCGIEMTDIEEVTLDTPIETKDISDERVEELLDSLGYR